MQKNLWKDTFRPDAKVGRFLTVLALSGVSASLYRGIQDNYLAEIVHISAFERGVVEFFRETPGLLVVLILALMYRFTESRVFKIGTALMLAGLTGFLLSGTGKIIVVAFMVLYSLGEHIIMPVKTTLTLDLTHKDKAGSALGIIGAIGQAGSITGFIIVMILFAAFSRLGFERGDTAQFKIVFAVAVALMLAATLVALALRENTLRGNRRRFYFARKFFTYYMLEVFYGARKQIFFTFAPYVLILQYGADASLISLLMAICAGCGMVCSPIVGKIIDKLGFKFIMVTDTLLLVVVCLLYGFAHRIFPMHIAFIVVCVNYVLDSIVSLASMATNVYVQSLASGQEELTATLSTGVSVNHVISILIALLGGAIWEAVGIETLFTLSAVLGLINSLYAATIKVRKEK
ncbi:MAG: MFS transporter [Treponema sp.]|jgi:MFS family permease|nr:MFS transporter [Treponema sp.]